MTFPFDPSTGAIVVAGELAGPAGDVELRLLLDTGAITSVISSDRLQAAGYDPAQPLGQISLTTASSTGNMVGFFRVRRLSALAIGRLDFPVLSYSLPPGVDFDGLLGIDFFEGRVLTLNFINNIVELY